MRTVSPSESLQSPQNVTLLPAVTGSGESLVEPPLHPVLPKLGVVFVTVNVPLFPLVPEQALLASHTNA
jgi:hypothetical protein